MLCDSFSAINYRKTTWNEEKAKKYIEMRYCKLYTNGQVNAVIIFLVVLMVYRNTFNCWCILNLFCEDLNLFFLFLLWNPAGSKTSTQQVSFLDTQILNKKFMSPIFIQKYSYLICCSNIWKIDKSKVNFNEYLHNVSHFMIMSNQCNLLMSNF